MVDAIKGIGAVVPHGAAQAAKAAGAGTAESFANALKDSIGKVNEIQKEADAAIEALANGESKNIHDTMIAVEKANLTFNMMLQVRNKLLAAYEEVMRMQV